MITYLHIWSRKIFHTVYQLVVILYYFSYLLIIVYRWLIRCPPGYFIKLNVTSYQVERNFEEVLLYDATNGGNSLVGEITSLGEFATTSSELILVFKSDCEVTGKGFQAIVEFSERVVPTTASYVPTTEQTTIIPTSTSNYVPTTEPTTEITTDSIPGFKFLLTKKC